VDAFCDETASDDDLLGDIAVTENLMVSVDKLSESVSEIFANGGRFQDRFQRDRFHRLHGMVLHQKWNKILLLFDVIANCNLAQSNS